MTPIPIADPPRIPASRPDPDANSTDERPDPDEGVPDAFLVAMGLVPGPAAQQPAAFEAEDGGGTPLPRTDLAAAPALAAPPLSAHPAGACGEVAAADPSPGSSAADDPALASPAAVSVGEIAFRASNLTADPPTSADGDARPDGASGKGPDGEPADAIAGDSDPAMPGGRDAATGSDGQTADPGEQAPDAAPRLRARGSGAEAAPVTADIAGEGAAARPSKGVAASAVVSEMAADPRPAFRVRTDSPGAADALSATPATIMDLAAGDPAAGARIAERSHPATHAASTLPSGFGHRLAEAVAHFPDRGVELTLSPEELGRVRMMLSTHDGALTLAIQADRPETIDLMRRHIDQLVQDFRDLGFTDVSFSFSRDDTASGGQRPEPEPGDPAAAPAADSPPRSDPAPAGASRGGLDLRL